MKIIFPVRWEEGYCAQCDLPKRVVLIELSGWKNAFCICCQCLEAIVKTFERG